MKRLTLVIPCVLSIVLIGIPQAAPLAAESEKGEKKADAPENEVKVIRVELDAEAQAEAKAKSKARARAKREKIKNPLWWNDDQVVEALSLNDDQRTKMAAFHKAFRKNVPETRTLDAFHEAIATGNWKTARAENEKTVDAAIDSVRSRGLLKVDILSLLNKDQLVQLKEKFPRLIYKPWRRAMRMDAPEPVAKNDS